MSLQRAQTSFFVELTFVFSRSPHRQQFGDREIPGHPLRALLHESCSVMLSDTQRCEVGARKGYKDGASSLGSAPRPPGLTCDVCEVGLQAGSLGT